MAEMLRSLLAIIGRLCLSAIFLASAFTHLIPNLDGVIQEMQAKGMPAAPIFILGAIGVLVIGSALLVLGYKARFGALLLLLFLVPYTYYFQTPWNAAPGAEFGEQLVHFLKNIGLAGAMLLIIAAGPGPGSIDERTRY
jgi:putative oxidoreductase